MLQIKRIYEQPTADDGERVVIDRLWPRGVSKEKAAIDLWLKEIAPSTELRKWFNHQPERFDEFSEKYSEELSHNSAVTTLKKLISEHQTVTLLYAAKDPKINHAVVLQKFLRSNGL